MTGTAKRCLPRVLCLSLPWLAVLGLASSGTAHQEKNGKTNAPVESGAVQGEKPQGGKQPSNPPKGKGPQSGTGKALNRFLQGDKGAKSAQDPKKGKTTAKPEADPKKDPKQDPKQGSPTPGGTGKGQTGKTDEGKAAAQSLEKFLHGKTKKETDTKGEPPPGVGAEGQSGDPGPRVLIPPPIELGRALPDESMMPFTGNLSSWYRYRRSADEHDQQLIGLLALDYGDSDRDEWSAHFLGRGAWDMDGNQPGNIFNGILQTYPNAVTGRIYTLYVQRLDLGPFSRIRLGRQEILETPEPAWIDGLRMETEAFGRARVRGGGYLGRATRIFASSEDALSAGLNLELEPWFLARLRIDWMYVDQKQPSPSLVNQLFGLSYWQSFGEDNRFFARITSLEDRGRDLVLRDTAFFPDLGLQVEVSYIELLTTQRQQVVDFDLFTGAAFEYKPYRQFQLHLDQEFTDQFNLSGGVDTRLLKHSSDEGRFNREYDRFFLSASLHDLFRKTTTFNVTWDRFDSGGEEFDALSADCICRFAPEWEARVGSTYSLFKYDWTTSQEREHVRTYDLGLTWRPNPALRLRFLYLLEDDDIGRFHSLRAAFSWDF